MHTPRVKSLTEENAYFKQETDSLKTDLNTQKVHSCLFTI